ncbi:MAG: damage-control phosphatase, subfamily [Thermoproteota archaeon]|nr:damage-control phosphatase, subfamily [Thermoproteota archaeon]
MTAIRTKATCILCILEDIYAAAESVGLDEVAKQKIMNDTMKMLTRERTREEVPSYYITEAHRILKRDSRREDPFEKERRLCNEVGLKVAERIDAEQKTILEDYERFRFLVKWAVSGNMIDIRTVGTGYNFGSNLYNQLFETFKEKLSIDDTETIFDLIKNPKKILYVLDNVGEIALDNLLIRELKRYGNFVTVAIRGSPMTSDATREDLVYIGADKIVDNIITTGADTLGFIFSEASEEFLQEIARVDLTIGKGQANFYSLSTHRASFVGDVVSLFRTKCNCISSLFGKNGKIGIATIIPTEKK